MEVRETTLASGATEQLVIPTGERTGPRVLRPRVEGDPLITWGGSANATAAEARAYGRALIAAADLADEAEPSPLAELLRAVSRSGGTAAEVAARLGVESGRVTAPHLRDAAREGYVTEGWDGRRKTYALTEKGWELAKPRCEECGAAATEEPGGLWVCRSVECPEYLNAVGE